MAKKGATEAVKTMVVAAKEYAHGITLLGGTFLLIAGGVAAVVGHFKELELVRKEIEVARKEVEVVRMEGRKEVEVARRETAEKLLTYQKLLKLQQAGQAEVRDGDSK